jgi:hypothetical protein
VLSEKGGAEYVFWVGCTGALMDRNMKVTQAMAAILKTAGVDFAVLGEEEVCTGDPPGGSATVPVSAVGPTQHRDAAAVWCKNLDPMPHCFNTFSMNTLIGGTFEVIHHPVRRHSCGKED